MQQRAEFSALAGPVRSLPDRRAHQLFEQRVRQHPDAVAAIHRGERWTYRQLNERANHLAHALLARGVTREQVVAVIAERDLDWLASVLAVFKAGACYLPIEPQFPPERIANMLTRSDCRIALSTAATAVSAGALAVDALYREPHPVTDPEAVVGADDLAYIYFTSGSTGVPKGAMCEHGGMLNHLFAKIDDIGIEAGTVVAQTAPQCFDISLWQLIAALLVGGRTLIIEQDAILDPPRMVDMLAEHRVNVVQLVPSYLDVLLSCLDDRPVELPDLRCVSVTGEAVKKPLVARFFERFPGVAMLNAYGLTETHDDTNHELLRRVPDGDRIPLGRPINNILVYVLDEDGQLTPFGEAGEIAFSGVCVGRGYINDEERTREVFVADPHRPGARMYRSGDYGRWLPDGKLEFLGRRDAQVKIHGFRIEIGEIEHRLLRLPGVRDAAVVVAPGSEPKLVAFYSGPSPLPVERVREFLAASLPAYMVPQHVHWLPALPLTDNGKVAKKALTALANDHVADARDGLPESATERRLAEIWADIFGIPSSAITRHDNFFDRGGTSLSAVRLAARLDRAVSLTDLADHPVLADLARLLDTRAAT